MAASAPRPDPRLRVVVVDADDRTRESLSGLLSIGDRLQVAGGAGTSAAALALIAAERPDVVIVDPRLPDVDAGLAFLATLRSMVPDIRILAMSWSDALEATALAGGADGFVRKTFRPAELVAAIETTGHGPDPASER